MAENPSFDFASRDFANIKNDLLTRASRALPDWTDRDPSDFTMALIELWAYTGDILHYYIDRAAQESFITTATKRESVLSLANLFDYTPRFIRESSGIVYLSNSGSASTVIPENTRFSGIHNNTLFSFYTDTEYPINVNETIAVTAYEGVLYEKLMLTASATGQIGQRYTIPATNAVPGSVRIFITEGSTNEIEWPRVANVNSLPANTAGFSVYVNPDQTLDVVFGNRLSGKIPTVGASIKVTYAVCSGSVGNVPSNTVTAFTSNAIAGVSVGTSTAFTGGSDIESVDSMKRSIKATVRTQQRAVTLQDFADYASLTAGVYKAVASYSASASTVTLHAMPLVTNYTTYSAASVPVPSAIQTDLVSSIQPLALLGVTVASAPTVFLHRLNIQANVYVKPNYVSTAVKADVLNAIDGLFELDNLDFGKEIRIGDVYRTILSVAGVDYAEISSFQIVDPNNGNAVVTNFASAHPTKFLAKGTVVINNSGGITTS